MFDKYTIDEEVADGSWYELSSNDKYHKILLEKLQDVKSKKTYYYYCSVFWMVFALISLFYQVVEFTDVLYVLFVVVPAGVSIISLYEWWIKSREYWKYKNLYISDFPMSETNHR